MKKMDFSYNNFFSEDLMGKSFKKCELRFAKFNGANCDATNFRYAKGTQTDFRWASLCYSDLSFSSFWHPDFRYSNMENSRCEAVDFTKANFEEANLSGATFKNAECSSANFKNAELIKVDFDGANLEYANFEGAKFFRCRGNNKEIKNLVIGPYDIVLYKDQLAINYKQYTIDKWFSFDDDDLMCIDFGDFLLWWKNNKDFIKSWIDKVNNI